MRVMLFFSNSISGCNSMVDAFKSVCRRYNLEHEVVFIETQSWMFPVYDVDGIPTIVLAEGNKPLKKTIGMHSESAFENLFNEWGLKHDAA